MAIDSLKGLLLLILLGYDIKRIIKKKIINFKKSNQMKKLEISQMENLQGGVSMWKCYAGSFITGFGIGSLQPEVFAVGAIIAATYCPD